MSRLSSNVLGMVGALIGGGLGVLLFRWVASQGFYGPFLIGGMVGLGSMALAQHPSRARGLVCGVLAISLELVGEWWVFPFVKDPGLGYFLANFARLGPLKLGLMGLGGVMAAYLGRDHRLLLRGEGTKLRP